MADGNIFDAIPSSLPTEQFEDLLRAETVRIERILSRGQTSPETGWYDQDEHEWVIVLQGCATLRFDDGVEKRLAAGDYINIPAHKRHKVAWTDPDVTTVWLAIFYRG